MLVFQVSLLWTYVGLPTPQCVIQTATFGTDGHHFRGLSISSHVKDLRIKGVKCVCLFSEDEGASSHTVIRK